MPDETLIPVPGAAADPAPAPAPAPAADPAPAPAPADDPAPDVLERIAALESENAALAARVAVLEGENAAASIHAGSDATLGTTVAKIWTTIFGTSD